MITLNKLAKKCYDIATRKGQINRFTSRKAYIIHISSEWRALCDATDFRSDNIPHYSEQEEEAADVIINTITFLQRIGCKDIEQLIRDKIEFNERRK